MAALKFNPFTTKGDLLDFTVYKRQTFLPVKGRPLGGERVKVRS